jgi:hypothetical protein
MKSFAKCMVLLLLSSSTWLKAQPKTFPDSVRIEIPDHQSIVTFEMREYASGKNIITGFPSQLGQLHLHISTSVAEQELQNPKRVEVIYRDDDEEGFEMKVYEPSPLTTLVTVRKEAITELLPPGWEIIIRKAQAEIHVYAPDFERLKNLTQVNLQPVVTYLDADPETLRQKRMGLISRVVLKNGKVEYTKTSHRLPNDMLGLHAGAGAGLLQDKLYPEFNFTTSFYFSNRYRENFQRVSAHYELKVFSARSDEGNYRTMPAGFLSLSYGLNFQKDRPRWTALGVGFMIHDKSDLFNGKTMKIFLETDIGSSKLNLIPELYLTDDYKKTLLGIKLNYKF